MSKPLTLKPDHPPAQQAAQPPSASPTRWPAESLLGALLRFFGAFCTVLATAILLAWLGTWSEESAAVALAQATAGKSAQLAEAHRPTAS